MDKWLQVIKDKIGITEFMSYGIIEPVRVKSSYRVLPGQMSKWDGNDIELRKMISDLFFQHSKETKKSYECTTLNCGIPEDTMRKILSGRCTISRQFLAKFTVGLKIDRESADKLFELHSGELNPTNKFDYVVMCALRDGDEFDDFYEDVKKYCEIDLIRERASKV